MNYSNVDHPVVYSKQEVIELIDSQDIYDPEEYSLLCGNDLLEIDLPPNEPMPMSKETPIKIACLALSNLSPLWSEEPWLSLAPYIAKEKKKTLFH